MNRETKVIKTATHEIVIKSYLTFEEVESAIKGTEDKFAQSASIVKAAVVSVDGVVEDAYNKARQLPYLEYKPILDEVLKMVGGDFPPAK